MKYTYITLFLIALISFSSCKKKGCTNYIAENFDKRARVDDGSCVVKGCMDPYSLNYNEDATINDGSCTVLGCTDITSSNYNPSANTDDGSCQYNGTVTFWSGNNYLSDTYIYVDNILVGFLPAASTASSLWWNDYPTCGQSENCVTISLSPGEHEYYTGVWYYTLYVESEGCELIGV